MPNDDTQTIRLHHYAVRTGLKPRIPLQVPERSLTVSNQTDFGIKSNQLNQVDKFHCPSSLRFEIFKSLTFIQIFEQLKNSLSTKSEGSLDQRINKTGLNRNHLNLRCRWPSTKQYIDDPLK